jgi:hypothetical protein
MISPDDRSTWQAQAAVCAAVFGLLVVWLVIFPYTGEPDSVLHYLNARDASVNPADCLHVWARPGYKLLLVWFAVHGITTARVFMAAMTTVLAWQTIRLADDLKISRACLAGALLLWQPMAFALAADTMTEMPMALGLVLAIRLWLAGRLTASCLVLGYLPAVRPEGFFFGVMWGFMVVLGPTCGPWWKRTLLLISLAAGLVAWVLACWYWTGDPWHVYHVWNWPLSSYEVYGRGSLLHYIIGWPVYGGLPLTLLLLAGIGPSLRKEMWLPCAAWGLVLGVHSILYWRGWFASDGMLRILACTSPLTALICLHGWNRLDADLQNRHWQLPRRRRAGFAFAAVATAWMLGQYCCMPDHVYAFPLLRCTAFIREHQLIGSDTWFFAGNKIAIADLDLPPHDPHLMDTPAKPLIIRDNLAALPIGAIGVWDNRQAPIWLGQTIDSLTANGFTILYDTTTHFPWRDIRCVVLRKDRPFSAATPLPVIVR